MNLFKQISRRCVDVSVPELNIRPHSGSDIEKENVSSLLACVQMSLLVPGFGRWKKRTQKKYRSGDMKDGSNGPTCFLEVDGDCRCRSKHFSLMRDALPSLRTAVTVG